MITQNKDHDWIIYQNKARGMMGDPLDWLIRKTHILRLIHTVTYSLIEHVYSGHSKKYLKMSNL